MTQTIFVTEEQGRRAVRMILELVEQRPHKLVVGGDFLEDMNKLAREILEYNDKYPPIKQLDANTKISLSKA